MSLWKKLGISLLSILIVACVTIDAWYLVVLYYGEDVVVVNTYEVGLQESTSGETNYFIEIKYYSNANNNGLEMLDIKFNYFIDEDQNDFYSQGLQYVANSVDDSIVFWDISTIINYLEEMGYNSLSNIISSEETAALSLTTFADSEELVFSKGGWYDAEYYYTLYVNLSINEETTSIYNYMSGNDYETTLISTNPLDSESFFRIQLDDELFTMKFKGSGYNEFNEATFELNKERFNSLPNATSWSNYHFNLLWAYTDFYALYYSYDFNYFAYLLYTALQSLPAGTNKAMVFEFGDMFNYYEYEGDGRYSDTAIFDSSLLIEKIMSYYSIKVEVYADGAQQASDSLFNCIQGSSTFNLTSNYESKDYFTGRQVITVDIYDFNLINVRDNYYLLKLSDDFNDTYLTKSNVIYLSIVIDLDIFNEYGYEFLGFTNDSGLSNYEIYECYTTETINSNVVKTEVNYA